jgi:pimeloyl-ACP methyl ester carboxylesterase
MAGPRLPANGAGAPVRANGVELFVNRYRTGPAGERPVVVFVHGLVVEHAGLGFLLGMPLASGHDVLVYDLRGHGRSELVSSGYRVTDHVGDLVGLLDALGVTASAHLVAYSYGGAVAWLAACRHPDRVASVTLVEGMVPAAGWTVPIVSLLERVAQALERGTSTEEAMRALGLTSARRADAIAGRVRRLLDGTSLLDDLRREPELAGDHLRPIACPVLGIYAAGSDFHPLADLVQALLPAAQVHTLPDADHCNVLERTRGIRALVEPFVERAAHPGPAAPEPAVEAAPAGGSRV